MEDLYGKTLNKSLTSPDGGGKYAARSAFGRLTPVPVLATTPAAAGGRLLNGRPAFVPLSGRLTPSEAVVSGRASVRQKQQAGPQSSTSNVLSSSATTGGGGGLLNISSHNSSTESKKII